MTLHDPRLTPARGDLAAAHLEGTVRADRYVAGTPARVIEGVAPVRRLPRPDGPLDTEALYGETLTVYDEDAEGWAARELKRFGAKGYLNWSRRERTWYDRCGVNPCRHTVTFEERALGAWMQLGGSQRKFLLGPAGEVITQGYGLDQPGSARS